MSCVIRALGFADSDTPCPHADQWLKSFDHDAYDGRGYGVFTDKILRAKRFASKADALAFWNTQSTVQPWRPDGRPNKPLTALSVEIEEIL
jgi:hypothetical protein